MIALNSGVQQSCIYSEVKFMNANGDKRPTGVVAVTALLMTMGAILFSVAIFMLASDMEYLSSMEGLKMQIVLLLTATAGCGMAAVGLALWHGWNWSWHAALVALVGAAAWFGFRGVLAGGSVNEIVMFGLSLISTFYLLLPRVRSFYHSVLSEETAELAFTSPKVMHGAA